MRLVLSALLIGAFATACIDFWALLLRRSFGLRSLDYCLLGRWVLHMKEGRFKHANIAASTPARHECASGWVAHYSIGIGFAVLFLWSAPVGWLEQPTLPWALAFGLATVIVPFATLQPAFGLGFAASKTPRPTLARLKSLATHAVFGAGLYLGAAILSGPGQLS